MTIFAERLKDLRYRKGQTQDEVGKAVGKSREAVSKYEIGEREPDSATIVTLARHFNVSADYILGITDEPEVLIGNKRKPVSADLHAYESYLADPGFIPYLQLAVRIRDNKVNLSKVEKFVNELINS